ncbi:MAG: YihY/virulence factor BrkB family protein [Planctomycetia bacterium]|nr:YihY/virulence factor BrkB family protein [Planctomycetia bacterium]
MAKKLWHVLHQTGARWARNDGNLLAAGMAYYAAFSFFPLLLVLISALGFALQFSASAQGAQEQLLDLLKQNTAPALADEVRSILADVLTEVQTRALGSGFVGLVTLLLGAIGIFSQLESAFDRIWQGTTPHGWGVWSAIRNALWNRLKAFLTLVGLGLLVIVAFAADLILTAIKTWAQRLPVDTWAWQDAQSVLSISLNAIMLTLLYRLIPRAAVRWRDAFCGGIVVALVWQLGSQAVSWFVVGGNYSAYGVVGSFIAMMLWVYCASILLFFGAQMVQVLGYPEEPPAGKTGP